MPSAGSRAVVRPSDPTSATAAPGPPAVPLTACPIATSLGTLGRKWTLTILRDIAFVPDASFSLILRNNPGLLQRTLSLRLRELAADGLVERRVAPEDRRHPRYRLTERGRQVWPVLATLVQFGARNYPERVFADGRARDLEEVFPNDLSVMLGRFAPGRPPTTTARLPAGER